MKEVKNVLLEKVVRKNVLRHIKTKDGWTGTFDQPKEGYRNVLWVTCPKDMKPEVASCLVTRKAQKLARILNTLPREDAVILVRLLHDAGRMIQPGLMREKNKEYTGRSFEWPRM